MTTAQETLASRLVEQAGHCARLGSHLYAGLLERLAYDVRSGGPGWELLRGHERDPGGSMLALRAMGAVHRLVLDGRTPELARRYAERDSAAAWPPFLDALERHRDELRRHLEDPVQTNEVGRSAVLVGGFALVARATGLPLRLLELGASAGLNLRFDRFAYESEDAVFGDAQSPVRIAAPFTGPRPPLDVPISVAERRGCDAHPVDPCSADGRLTLLSYLWPDQVERRRRLEAAIEVAQRVPAVVDPADAVDWLAERLDEPAAGAATVVFHTIVLQYLPPEGRQRLADLLRRAGERADAEAPLAHLAMEAGGDMADVRLTVWPGGDERLIARAGYHGEPVRWLE